MVAPHHLAHGHLAAAVLRLEQHDAEDTHQGDDHGQHREEPDDRRQTPLLCILEAQLLLEGTNLDIARRQMRVGLGDALPQVAGHLRDVGLGTVAQVEDPR